LDSVSRRIQGGRYGTEKEHGDIPSDASTGHAKDERPFGSKISGIHIRIRRALNPPSIKAHYPRVFMFLQAFSDKIGAKLCKRCRIDIDDTGSTAKVWNELRKEALSVCTKDDSQMSKLWKAKKQMESPGISTLP